MSGELLYLDSSALVKLVLPEAESAALLESLAAWPVRLSRELARVEVVRAVRRAPQAPPAAQRAALRESLAAWPVRLSSELARVEVVRAVRRATQDPAVEQRAEEVLA